METEKRRNGKRKTKRLTSGLSGSLLYLCLYLCLAVTLWPPVIFAQQSPTPTIQLPAVTAVAAVGMTVSDMDRRWISIPSPFFEKSQTLKSGTDYEHLQGVFGLRMRVVRLRLGNETID